MTEENIDMKAYDSEIVWVLCKDNLPPRSRWVIMIPEACSFETFRKRCFFGRKWKDSLCKYAMRPNDKWRFA
jgi:hypothetical protein